MRKLVRSVVLPLLLLLGVMPGMPGGRPHDAFGVGVTSVASRTHTLDVAASAESTTALQPGSAASVAHLTVAPRQAWQSRHDHLKPKWDRPLPAPSVANPSGFDTHDSYVAMIRIAVTGSVSFRATSLPPPTL